ncbi:unnamed protein product [Ilex paraguariensis]|uniref:Uncharacterized protein n=1 Tax=Ilex paraguariensis TaxID=185542 RepID=A0ABC8T1K6_9AQUA
MYTHPRSLREEPSWFNLPNNLQPHHVFNNSIIQNPNTLTTTAIPLNLNMSVTSQNLLANSQSRFSFYFTNTHFKTPTPFLPLPSKHFTNSLHFQIPKHPSPISYNFKSFNTHHWPLKAFKSEITLEKQNDDNNFNLDAFLSILEFLCLGFSAIISIGFAVNVAISKSQNQVLGWLWNKVFVWQCVLLVGGVVIGAVIRRRQWRRISLGFSRPGGSRANLVERIEKLEEDLRSSATIIKVLSRQFEKLGIRFRVTRKALKDPIAEAAALAQKNSEATRALAIQEDLLEKELGEMQKVLLAMQEQQQKQFELILAIGKTGKLWESRREHTPDQNTIESSNSSVDGIPRLGTNQIQALAGQNEASNDRA